MRTFRTAMVALACTGLMAFEVSGAAADTVVRVSDLQLSAPHLLAETNGRLVGSGAHLASGQWGSVPGISTYDTGSLRPGPVALSQMAIEDLAGARLRNSVYYAGNDGIGRFDVDSGAVGQLVEAVGGYRALALAPDEQLLYAITNVSGYHARLSKIRTSDLTGLNSVVLNPDDPTPDGSVSYPQILVDPGGEYGYVLEEPVGELVEDDSSILQIRLSDMTITQTLTIGQDVNYLSMNGDGTRIYATSSNELNKIVQPRLYEVTIGTDLKVSRVQNAQGSLGRLAIDAYSRYAYVAQGGPNVVLKYDLASMRVAETIPLASRPSDLVISPDGSLVYVSTERGLEKISVKPEITGISPAQGSVTGTTSVAIRGRYLNAQDASVTVGGVPCLKNNRQPSAAYHCTLRQTDEEVGPASVRVINPGDQKDVAKDLFTFTRKQYPTGPGCFDRNLKNRGLIPPGCRKTTAGSPVSANVTLLSITSTAMNSTRGDRSPLRLFCRTQRGSRAQVLLSGAGGYVRCRAHQTLTLGGLTRHKKIKVKVSYYAPPVKGLKAFRKTTRVTLKVG